MAIDRERIKLWHQRMADLDSSLEAAMADTLSKARVSFIHHPSPLKYIVPASEHKYTTDFIVMNNNKQILIETKGYFRTKAERDKYIHIRESLNSSDQPQELIFFFSNGKTPIAGAKKRKDGTRLSVGEWATTNKFTWFDMRTIPQFVAYIKPPNTA